MHTIAEIFDLAARYHQGGNLAQAEPLYRQILQADSAQANAYHLMALVNLAGLLKVQGQLEEAARCYRQALGIDPHHAGIHNNLGLTLQDLGKPAEAIGSYRQALRINPQNASVLFNLGTAFLNQEQLGEAAECYRQALRIQPNYASAYINLGNVLRDQGQIVEAIECFQQALRINPNDAGAHNNLGSIFFEQRQLTEAAACFRQALVIDPANTLARWNRSLVHLLQGDLEGGWPDFELRLALPGAVPRAFQKPSWDGSPLEGKTILVYTERGLGDTLQFMRYLPLVQGRGGIVVFECQPALCKLLAGIPGVDKLVPAGTPLPPFDVQAPLFSLPRLFGTTLANIPAHIPYLAADPKRIEHWRRELESIRDFKVGIVWQGSNNIKDDPRSLPLTNFEVLAREVEGVSLVSLQKGPGTEQIVSLARRFDILDLTDRLDNEGALVDTAAVMMNLDLVVTVDTSIPHLAGALGVAVWVALSFAADWRWLLDREDSPWYPTMRLFRQRKHGEWGKCLNGLQRKCKKGVRNFE